MIFWGTNYTVQSSMLPTVWKRGKYIFIPACINRKHLWKDTNNAIISLWGEQRVGGNFSLIKMYL